MATSVCLSSVTSMCPGERVDRAMNNDDLPIVAVLFEDQRIRSLKLTSCFVDDVVEPSPSGSVPITDAKVRDGEFPRRSRGEDAVHPNRGRHMMAVLIKPDGVRRDHLLKITSVLVIKGGNERTDHADQRPRRRYGRREYAKSAALLRSWRFGHCAYG